MDEKLLFAESPTVTLASVTFINTPIPIRYEDDPMLELVKEVQAGYTIKMPIYHSDGTKLAVAKASQLYRTKEGEKAGIEMRHLPDGTVCEWNGKPIFEIRRKGAAALSVDCSEAGFHSVVPLDYFEMGRCAPWHMKCRYCISLSPAETQE